MVSEDYHISFFKPTTDSARRNRNMVVQLVLIWAVAIFGFQFLLKILEKPTPEPSLGIFENNWPAVEQGKASSMELQASSQAVLSVLGKVAIQPDHRQMLHDALSSMAWQLALEKEELKAHVAEFENLAASAGHIADEAYLKKKSELIPILAGIFGLEPVDVRTKIAPLEIKSSMMESFDAAGKEQIGGIMSLYLTHNQSFLTDARFLGFPFHYFYTAIFLLILFVGLCWLYCIRTDQFNKKYGIED